jgi:hypothetical protein
MQRSEIRDGACLRPRNKQTAIQAVCLPRIPPAAISGLRAWANVVEIGLMRFLNTSWIASFLHYVFRPLTNPLVIFILLVWFFASVPYFNAYRMNIPKANDLMLVVGILVDNTKHAYKTNSFGVEVLDVNRDKHYCNCEPGGTPNCFSSSNRANAEKIQALAGKNVVVWMFPSKSIVGAEFACYEVSDEYRVYRSYEQSVNEYRNAKNSIGVIIALLSLFCIVGLLCVRAVIFIKRATYRARAS